MSLFKKKEKRGSEWETLLNIVRGGGAALSGVTVSESTSLTMSAVFNALTIISETLSTVPLQIFRKTDDGRELFTDHPLFSILHDRANRTESAQSFRETFVWNIEMRGLGIALKVRDGNGIIKELWNMNPADCTEITSDAGGRLRFTIRGKQYDQSEVFYCYGPGRDGLTPRGRLTFARESIGLGLAAQAYGSHFFNNGTHIGGFITHEGVGNKGLSDAAHARLKADLNAQYEGLSNSHKLILLEEGMKYAQAGMTNEDSQFLESRQFQIAEIARFFNIPQHLIGALEHATFSNIEHQGIQAVRYSWRPRAVRIDQAINVQLISSLDRGTVYAEHNLNGLMQGDLMSQASVWHLLIQDGVLNANEVRSMMNMNDQPGDQGNIYFSPLNMQDKANPAPTDLRSISDYRSWGESLAAEYAKTYGSRFDSSSYLRSVGKLIGALERRGISDSEKLRMEHAFSYAAMQASGVTHTIFRSGCDEHKSLDGKVFSIGEAILDGAKHPPFSSGCRCKLEAVR